MIKLMTDCHRTRPLIDALVRDELSHDDAGRVTAHTASCTACGEELAEARAAFEVLLAGSFDDFEMSLPSAALDSLRERTMTAIRQETETATPSSSLRYAWSGIAAAALVGLVTFGMPNTPTPTAGTAGDVLEATLMAPAEAIQVVSTFTDDGTVLTWQGEGRYRVLRSDRAGFVKSEETVVCGNRWTDRSGPATVVFYRVEAIPETCTEKVMQG